MECANCLGTGIVGNGDKPWLHEGLLATCPVCSGTGKVAEGSPSSPIMNSASPRTQTATPESSVDNSTSTPVKPLGFFARIIKAL